MPEFTKHDHGTFCWIELVSSDADASKKFYCDIFGWTFHDDPIGPDSVYTMFQRNGKNVAAMFQLTKEMEAQGVPSNWGNYISVDDLDAVAARVPELGGKVMMGPMDVMDVGRMMATQDPTGAFVSFWQPKKHIGFEVRYEPNTLCWTELATNDTDRAGAYYSKLLGWNTQTMPMPTGEYTLFMAGQQGAGGMMEIGKDWGPVPPHWAIYMEVEDCDATCQKATDLGATIVVPPQDVPGVGRFATLRDPQGAHFGVIKSMPREG